jgi:hypothetical protein
MRQNSFWIGKKTSMHNLKGKQLGNWLERGVPFDTKPFHQPLLEYAVISVQIMWMLCISLP